ncbi:MAG: hypothetical protein IKF45_03400 [Lachnospiraceae bacterium]|nr:hypothetical protein [Lachnospiraceae bacterium]
MAKNKAVKGEYGAIRQARKKQALMTAALLALVLGLFFGGRLYYGSNRNIYSIMAALSCLPFGWSAVNLIMLLRAGMCSEDAHRRILSTLAEHRLREEDLTQAYDLYLTGYSRNFQISHVAIRGKNIAALTEDAGCDLQAAEEHICKMIANDGFSGYTIKLYPSAEKYIQRLSGLCGLERGNPEREEKLRSTLMAISL